jgi:membrane protein
MLMISISAVGATGLRALLDEVHFFTSVSHAFVASLQVAVIVAALFGTFYLTYYLVPTKRYKRRYVMEGSLLASSGWILISLIFASLVPTLLKSSAAYLALGSVVAILLWAQFCAWSIILGACWIVRFSPKPK